MEKSLNLKPLLNGLASYGPTLKSLRLKFRSWHVEALLNQAADLIEKCLAELKDYRSLDYSWNQNQVDLSALRATIQLDRGREQNRVFERDVDAATERRAFLNASDGNVGSAAAHAQKLYDFANGEGQGNAGWTRAGQNLNEKRLEEHARNLDRTTTEHRVVWGGEDAAYKHAELGVRATTMARKDSLSTAGQPFALDWQRDLVGVRMKRNYEDALDRALVAEQGLAEIYGHIYGSAQPPNQVTMDEAINHVAIWVRNSIEWLVAYQQRDQVFTRIASIRALIGTQWKDVHSAKESFVGPFDVPDALFASHENVRLRGVGASLLGKAGRVPWSLSVRVPKVAAYIRSGSRNSINQAELPPCLLGRVENRESVRAIEICGLISLMNASPIGEPSGGTGVPDSSWGIEIKRPEGTSEAFANIDDIVLEITAAGIPLIP